MKTKSLIPPLVGSLTLLTLICIVDLDSKAGETGSNPIAYCTSVSCAGSTDLRTYDSGGVTIIGHIFGKPPQKGDAQVLFLACNEITPIMLKYDLLKPADGPCPELVDPGGKWVSALIAWQKTNERLVPKGVPENALPSGVESNGIKTKMLPVWLQTIVNSKQNGAIVAHSVPAGAGGFTLTFGEVQPD